MHLIYEDTDNVQGAEVVYTGDFARDWEPAILRASEQRAVTALGDAYDEVARLRAALQKAADMITNAPMFEGDQWIIDMIDTALATTSDLPKP